MTIEIKKEGDNLYSAKSYSSSGDIEWESKQLMTAKELIEELVTKLKYHQIDVLDALKLADSDKYKTNIDIDIDLLERLVKEKEIDPILRKQLSDWLEKKRPKDR